MTTTTMPTATGPAIDADLPRAIVSSPALATPIVLDTVDTSGDAQVVEHDAAEALLNAWSDHQGRIAPEAMSTWSWFEHVDAFILGWVEGGEIRQDKWLASGDGFYLTDCPLAISVNTIL
jgi:hypothetical protein